MKTTVKNLPKSQVEINFVIPSQNIAKEYEKAYQKLAPSVKIDGFRPGKAPRNLIEEKIGEDKIYQEVFNDLLFEAYRNAITEHKLEPITYPQFKIEKFEKGKDLEVKTTISVRPKVKVGNYKKIKAKKKKKEMTEKEVKKIINEAYENWKQAKGGGKDKSQIEVATTLSEAESKAEKEKAFTFEDFIKESGAKDEADLLAKAKVELQRQADAKTEIDFENEIFDQLEKMTEVDLPEVLIEQELSAMLQNLQAQLLPLGLKFEDYLKQQGKSEEKLKEEWRENATKRVTIEFALAEVTRQEEIQISEDEIQKTIDKVENPKIREQLEKPEQKVYIKYTLQKSKTVEKLKELASE